MANLEINLPDDLHERLRRVAGAYDGAVSEFMLAVIRREVERVEQNERRELTMAEWQARREDRPILHIDFDAAAAIREERQQRTQQANVSRGDPDPVIWSQDVRSSGLESVKAAARQPDL